MKFIEPLRTPTKTGTFSCNSLKNFTLSSLSFGFNVPTKTAPYSLFSDGSKYRDAYKGSHGWTDFYPVHRPADYHLVEAGYEQGRVVQGTRPAGNYQRDEKHARGTNRKNTKKVRYRTDPTSKENNRAV